MAEITTQMVKELRTATSAGVIDCKKALVETDGDFEKAVEILRKKGLASAAKRASRDTKEGIIGNYVHFGSKAASLVELNCETDFVARTDQFQQLARDLAMHVVAARPLYVSREEVPADAIAREKDIYGEGKLDKWFSEVCLLEQPFIKEPERKIQDLLTDAVASLGENIRVNRFARLEIGG